MSETLTVINVDKITGQLQKLSVSDQFLVSVIARQQAEKNMLPPMETKVALNLKDPFGPVTRVDISDFHLPTIASELRKAAGIMDFIVTLPNPVVFINGDLLEGLRAGDDGFNSKTMDLNSSIRIARDWIYNPLARMDIPVVNVEDYHAHIGWMMKHGLRLWEQITQGFENVTRIQNGGIVTLVYPNSMEEGHKIWHNTSKKSSDFPLHGVAEEAKKYSAGTAPDVFSAAHIHQAGVAVTIRPWEGDPHAPKHRNWRGYSQTTLIQDGTIKGIGDIKDPFGVELGLGEVGPAGQGSVSWQRPGERGFIYPFTNLETGAVVRRAVELYSSVAEKILPELIGEAKRSKPPSVVFDTNASVNSYEEVQEADDDYTKDALAPQFRRAIHRADSIFPIEVTFASGMRRGHRSADLEQQKELFTRIGEDPTKKLVVMRQPLDKEIPGDLGRNHYLARLVKSLGPARLSLIGILLDEVLTDNKWKSEIDGSTPTAAGTYLSVRLGNVPLIERTGILEMIFKDGPAYTMRLMDKLGNRGASGDPTKGLLSWDRDLASERTGAIIGGHMPFKGFSSKFVGELNRETDWMLALAPGWMSKMANWSTSKANDMPGGPGSSSIILMPDRYMMIPVVAEAQEFLHDALILRQAVDVLKILDQNKITKRE